MQKIEYGDINKFLVSIGLVLIGLAILTPYLYLKEDFGLYIEKEAIDKFQEPIQHIITKKQEQVIGIQKIIPKVSFLLLLLGITSSFIGLKRWFKRQAKIDEKFDKEIRILDIEIESLTPEEKEEKAKKEVQEIELEEVTQPVSTQKISLQTKTPFQDYIRIEQDIVRVFENYKSPNFEILSQQRIGNKFEVDILLKAKPKTYSDRIVEIKYFRNQLPQSIIQKTLYQLNTYISYYKNAARKQVIPVLLIVYNNEIIDSDDILKFYNRIKDYSQDIPNLNRLKVEFIPEKEIEKFNVRQILKR
ncbi:MAG: hypothetical protein Q7T53_10425 [Deltaproteobacteria bacterium]|nr:hypothetical protein [Deltaproteobacteria bacterium]